MQFNDPLAIVMVDGGFCSQISKYVLGKFVETRLNIPVKYDLTWFEGNGMDCDNQNTRKFQLLDIFPKLDFEIATHTEVKTYKKLFTIRNDYPFEYQEKLFDQGKHIYVDGYYANWQYYDKVKSKVESKFDFSSVNLSERNKKFLSCIENNNSSVAIHVRRGDYVNCGWSILEEDYYLRAIEEITKQVHPTKPHLFFFSNGMDWVKSKILPRLSSEVKYTLVDENDNDTGYIDLFLISKCRHTVSSNSSFGYYGGLLNSNPDKIVIIPDKWLLENEGFYRSNETAHEVPGWTTIPYKG